MKIFDGYNLIGAADGIGINLAQPDKEERLLRLLSACRSRRRNADRWLVVFDGGYGRLAEGPKKYTRGGIEVEWAVGESADEVIVRRLRRIRHPREVEVVTSDGEVLGAARTAGAVGTRSQDFLRKVKQGLEPVPEAEKPSGSTPEEIREWLTIFGENKGPSD